MYKVIVALTFTYMILKSDQASPTEQFLPPFKEGQDAIFRFTFHFNISTSDVKFEVGLTKQDPLYEVGPKYSKRLLNDEEGKRFGVQMMNHSTTDTAGIVETKVIEIEVTIRNVSRSDAGTYVCVGYINGQKLQEYTRKYGISIEFPPGKASCWHDVGENESNSDMIILQCSASHGSQRGQGSFQCYQNGKRIQQFTDVYSNGSTIHQSLFVNKTSPAFCCSVAHREQKDCSGCNDSTWYNEDKETIACSSIANKSPRIGTTSLVPGVHTPTLVRHYITSFNVNVTEDIKHAQRDILLTLFLGVVIPLTVMSVICIYCFMLKFYSYNKKKNVSSMVEYHSVRNIDHGAQDPRASCSLETHEASREHNGD